MSGAFEQAWLLLKNVQARLPGYEGKMIADDRRKRRRDGRGFMDEPREMGPFLSPGEEVLNRPENREQQVARRRRPARIVRTFESPYAAANQYNDAVTYALEDDAGERLAEIHADKGDLIEGYGGEVPRPHRRKNYYRELIENLIRHGFILESSSRNSMSDPFHKKFIRTLPDDIKVDTLPDSDSHSEYDVHTYSHEPFFPGKHGPGGDWGDLRGLIVSLCPSLTAQVKPTDRKTSKCPEAPREGQQVVIATETSLSPTRRVVKSFDETLRVGTEKSRLSFAL